MLKFFFRIYRVKRNNISHTSTEKGFSSALFSDESTKPEKQKVRSTFKYMTIDLLLFSRSDTSVYFTSVL